MIALVVLPRATIAARPKLVLSLLADGAVVVVAEYWRDVLALRDRVSGRAKA